MNKNKLYCLYLLKIMLIVVQFQQNVSYENLWCPPNYKLIDHDCVSLTPSCPANYILSGLKCIFYQQQYQQQHESITQLCAQPPCCLGNGQPCAPCATASCQQTNNCCNPRPSSIQDTISINAEHVTFPAVLIKPTLTPIEKPTMPPMPIPTMPPMPIIMPIPPMPQRLTASPINVNGIPIYISKPHSSASVNPSSISNVIEITNIVHNNNTINNPTNINSTNVNNIFLYGLTNTRVISQSDDKANITYINNTEKSDITIREDEPCCTVMSPRQCKYENGTWNCFHRKYNRCGEFCTNPQVFIKPRRPIYVEPVSIIPPRPIRRFSNVQKCSGSFCPPINCSGCMNRRNSHHCSSECFNYDCNDNNCGYLDQNNFCATYGGAGCNEDDGCFASAGCRND